MLSILMRTDAAGAPILRCPECGAASDAGQFYVDAKAGLMECRTYVVGARGAHSRPYRAKIEVFVIAKQTNV